MLAPSIIRVLFISYFCFNFFTAFAESGFIAGTKVKSPQGYTAIEQLSLGTKSYVMTVTVLMLLGVLRIRLNIRLKRIFVARVKIKL